MNAVRAIATVIIALAVSGMQAQDTWRPKVERRVLEAAATGPTEFLVCFSEQADLSPVAALKTKTEKGACVVSLLQEAAERAQSRARKMAASRGLPYRSYWIANMLWVRGKLRDLQTLAEGGEVARIVANPSMRLRSPLSETRALIPAGPAGVEWNLAQVRAPEVWALGFTGQGVVVGGQDTGYEWDHPALIQHYRGWSGTHVDHNYNWHDAIHANAPQNPGTNPCGYDLQAPCDDDGHGTHTMGTLVGDDDAGHQIGMAPGARWIGCRNMERGWGTPAAYIECLQWFVAPTDLDGRNPDPEKAPDVINDSWVCPPEEGCLDPLILQPAVRNVRAAGIVVVAAASNEGPACGSLQYPPGVYAEVFAVGATDHNDAIAAFSSRGPATVGGSTRVKPDISAPGVNIRSSLPGHSYGLDNGTSMATPHVAGLVALLISAHPELRGQVDLIERLIEQTALPLTTSDGCGGLLNTQVPNNTFGWGRIDALAALGLGDADGDGMSDYQEILAGTDPHDRNSRLRITEIQPLGDGVAVSFTSATNRTYAVERTKNLGSGTWDRVADNLPGTGGVLKITDPSPALPGPSFYRIRLEP